MHMADSLLSPAVGGVMYGLCAAAAVYSVNRLTKDEDPARIPTMGVMGAFVFSTQMINFTIPGTGSSGHLCGGMLLSALLGPQAGFLTMIGVLLIQCLLFADGGILALGANIWNMAFYGCFVGALLIWKPLMSKGFSKGRIVLASILGCMITLQLGAFSVTLQTLCSGITALPFSVFVGMMQPIHLAIGFVEGLITAAVLVFVYEARPELLYGYEGTVGRMAVTGAGVSGNVNGSGAQSGSGSHSGRLGFRSTMVVLGICALVIGGFISYFASSNPDGLEWSMERVAGTTELEAEGGIYESVAAVQESTAILPDYAFAEDSSFAAPGSVGELMGTGFSGVFGALVVVVLCTIAGYGIRMITNKEKS